LHAEALAHNEKLKAVGSAWPGRSPRPDICAPCDVGDSYHEILTLTGRVGGFSGARDGGGYGAAGAANR
jgi:hypothetical protein